MVNAAKCPSTFSASVVTFNIIYLLEYKKLTVTFHCFTWGLIGVPKKIPSCVKLGTDWSYKLKQLCEISSSKILVR